MDNESPIIIRAAMDGSHAVISELRPAHKGGRPITVDDVKSELDNRKIVKGIKWDRIEEAVARAVSTSEPVRGILIAKAGTGDDSVDFLLTNEKLNKGRVRETIMNLTRAAWILERFEEDFPERIPDAYYVARDEKIFEYMDLSLVTDIFGKRKESPDLSTPFDESDSVICRQEAGWFRYFAKREGYLVIQEKKRLHIVSPLKTTSDRMKIFFIFLPVRHGGENLMQAFNRALSEHGRRLPNQETDSPAKSGRAEKRIVKEGILPVPGEDGRLIFRVSEKARPIEDKGQKLDYREISDYKEVREGALLVEKIDPKPGTPGMDVSGKKLPAEKPRDARFKAGKNIIREKGDGRCFFKAAVTGILDLKENYCSISKELNIRGNCGPETGNLGFSKNIVVGGSVEAGYSIECGGDLSIRGGVQAGARIVCKGDLKIARGIFGKKTAVEVHGNAEVGFMHEGNLRCSGHVTVRDYMYNSNLFCKGGLTVTGKSIRKSYRGAVIGGKINSMGPMDLDSVGSDIGKTELICGINLDLMEKKKQLDQLLPLLTRKIIRLQDSMGIDILSPNAAEKMAALGARSKSILKSKLRELKKTIGQRENVAEKSKEIHAVCLSKDLNELYVNIEKHLVPTVTVRLGHARMMVGTERHKTKYVLKDGEIVETQSRKKRRGKNEPHPDC